jgi:hypothetical protein
VVDLSKIQSKVVFGAMIGGACARAGFTDETQQIASLITPLGDPHSTEQMGYVHLLQGAIARQMRKQRKPGSARQPGVYSKGKKTEKLR